MLFRLKIFPLALLSLVVTSLFGCNQFSPLGLAMPEVTPIAELKYPPKGSPTVKIKGKVADRAPFLESGAYLLQDGTGTVWVRTLQTPPAEGKELFIEGKVEYQSIPLQQQELGGLYVKEVRQLDSAKPTPTSKPSVSPQAFPTKPSVKPLEEPFLPHKENKKGNTRF
jgi:hypothetical protein